MAKEEFVRDSSGNVTHVRVTSDDGRTSWLYEKDNSVVGEFLGGGRGRCVEVADHHKDGTTDAYGKDDSIIGELFFGGKGKHK